MRTIIRLTLCLTVAIPLTLLAAEQTAEIKVAGNCATCKKRIEKAASGVSGVKTATWDKKKKVLTTVFEDTKTNTATISAAVLAVGHDVDTLSASQEAYEKLHECCKYR